jgi:AraC-like DNA-binding protein
VRSGQLGPRRRLASRIRARRGEFLGLRFAPHRNDTYAIGVTLSGVQSFGYRGTTLHSKAGCAFAIHPDEKQDGRPGTEAGYRYRIIYLEPRLIAEALSGSPLPFVKDAVTRESRLHRAILAALDGFDVPITDLHFDDIVATIADALAAHDGAPQRSSSRAPDAVRLARAYLDGPRDDVSSATLETLTGLSRFELARQFRACLGTSPHRYATMRRLERAKRLIAKDASLADAAAASGFADQSHMTRQFKQAYGISPGHWRALAQH